MKVALLTIPQARQLWHKQLAELTFFNPVIDKNGNVLITEDEINKITNPDYNWVKSLTLIEHDEVLAIPDFNPPTSNGKGIIIPSQYHMFFPIDMNGFIIELKTKGNNKYIEEIAVTWAEFLKELRKPQNIGMRNMLEPFLSWVNTNGGRLTI